MSMRILVGASARGRVDAYRKEIDAALPVELRHATFDFDLCDAPDRWSDALRSADVLVLTNRNISEEALASASSLRFVQKLGIDCDHLPLAACRQRGIGVSVISDIGHVAVAEHTIALAMASSRNLIASHNAVVRKENPGRLEPIHTTQEKRHVNWLGLPSSAYPLAADMTFGIVGLGEIAREVARRASCLFARIVYTKRNRLPVATEKALGVTYRPMLDLLAEADVVSLHATLPDGAPPIIGAREWAAMKRSAYFINTARGNQIDQRALIDALAAGRLRGAALDVFEEEPVFDDSLISLPNVILTPHTGIMIPMGRRFQGALTNIAALALGQPISGLVEP
jgi:phosphoglycerate dehydrogenase-like enzyme